MVIEKKEKPIEEKVVPWISHYEGKKKALRPFGDFEPNPKTEAIIARIHRLGKSKSALEKVLIRHVKELLS